MTACVNRKHTKKVAAVVTASLVGALSLGVAPVAAVADTGIETLAANWATGAKVTAATDGKGATVTGDLERKSFTAKSGKFLVPTEITGTYTTTEVDEDYLRYEKRNTSGGYSLVGATGSLDDAIAYFATGSTGTDTTGTYRVTYTYDSESYDVHFKISGEGKVEGVTVKGTPTYNGKDQSSTLSFVDAEGYEIANGATSSISYKDAKGDSAVPQNAGDYIAEFSDGTNTYSVPFSIAKLDLSTSTVVVKDTDTAIISEADLEDNLYINGSVAGGATGTLAGEIEVTKVTNPAGTAGFGSGKAGVYQVTIAPVANNKNITGTASISYCIVDDMVADAVEYNRVDYTGSTLKIELAYGDAFDASKIVVKDTAGNSYTGDDLEITYTDTDDNKTVDASALANVGEYELTIRVKPTQDFATGAWSGGTITLDVEVVAVGLDDSEDLAFFVDGELAGNAESVTYDGTDQLDKISVVVKGADGTDLVEGTDYEIKVTNTDTNREVDSIVDAGEYEIKVNPLTFSFGSSPNDTLTLTVNPIKIGLAVTGGDLKDFLYRTNTAGTVVLQNDAVAYTGSAVEIPTVKYPVLNEDGTDVKRDKDGNVVYADLSTDLYNIVSIKDENTKTVKEAIEEGEYTVKIALSDAAKSNYQLNDDKFVFEIREAGHFTDVDSTKWYSVAVEKAYSQWYINGISGTNLFAPEADITRADAVCIIYNMAGGDSIGDEDFSFDVDYGYNTGFSDVDGHAYFAKALAWARAFGVANGSNGEFRPYDQITREEFASLLANYAKAMGKFEAADASALDGMSDASTVSDWAKDNVAWAVESGIMGNGGFVAGQSNIIRAEVAAMAVNYQPEMIRTDKLPR
ncbi:hypothetical protein B5F74_11490 [Collinsella sp. An271]|nr:hypothetical protein B5F74_11490 [Collinsella sp. An271]